MTKTALITGVNGQDGSYMAEFLLNKGYEVLGTVRGKNSLLPFIPLEGMMLKLVDLGYSDDIVRLFSDRTFDEVYNFAAQTHVGDSFYCPEQTYRVTGVGACLLADYYFTSNPKGKFYQASSSEMVGDSEDGSFRPVSPYAVAKLMAHYNVKSHRNSGRFAVDGILFNHESERRHIRFVTQKICYHAVLAYKWVLGDRVGPIPKLNLGNIAAIRDWGYAPEYVEIIWNMMQLDTPNTWTVGTGRSESVEYFVKSAFDYLSLDWEEFTVYRTDNLMRPFDVHHLCADPTDANKLLGRMPKDVDWLVKRMVDHQLKIQGV